MISFYFKDVDFQFHKTRGSFRKNKCWEVLPAEQESRPTIRRQSNRKHQKPRARTEVDLGEGGLGGGGWGCTSSLNLVIFGEPRDEAGDKAAGCGWRVRRYQQDSRKERANGKKKEQASASVEFVRASWELIIQWDVRRRGRSPPPRPALPLQRLWWGRNKCIFFSFLLPFFSFPPPKLLPGWSYRYPCQKFTQNQR